MLFKRAKGSSSSGGQRRVWRNQRTGEAVGDLPPGACTTCGWWHSAASGMWMHAGSGATMHSPPPLSMTEADKRIRAHLGAMEAAEAL